MSRKIVLIDTMAANTHSVFKALKHIGANVELTSDKSAIEKSDIIFFPGVGAFGAVMNSIKQSGLSQIISTQARSGKPFFGICVGMQVLFESSEESESSQGLNIFKGKVVKFKKARVIPHIGWNNISSNDSEKYYFVHSYYCEPEDKTIVYASTEYDGEIFPSIIKKDNLFATQFHPEKSGEAGLALLSGFLKNS